MIHIQEYIAVARYHRPNRLCGDPVKSVPVVMPRSKSPCTVPVFTAVVFPVQLSNLSPATDVARIKWALVSHVTTMNPMFVVHRFPG